MFSVGDYKLAFADETFVLNKKQIKMLQFHYYSPNRTVTVKQLANSVGYLTHHAANIHYSKIGKLLSNKIGKKPEKRLDGSYRWWKFLSSGIRNDSKFVWVMLPNLAIALEQLELVNNSETPATEEIIQESKFLEGTVRKITVNAYERSSEARSRCIAFHGTQCSVCGFDFGLSYGEIFEGYIHVHHLKPLSEIGENYEVDAINDLRPVCPNCHAVIHRRNPPFSIDEVKSFLSKIDE